MIVQKPKQKSILSIARTIADHEGIFNQMPLPACMVDLEQRIITKINPALEKFLDQRGLKLNELLLPVDRLADGDWLLSEEYTVRSAQNGNITYLLTSGEMVGDDNTTILYLNDVTYMKKIEASFQISHARLSTTLSTAQIGLWDTDPVSGLTYICPQMAKDWGLDHTQNPIQTNAILQAIHPEDRASIWAAVEKAMAQGIPYFSEYRVVRPDGTTVWIEGRGEYIKDINGYPFRFAGTSLDITERVNEKLKLQQELKEQKELVAQLKQAQLSAESANKNKTMFLANVSHEIRTPLTAILGFADLLKDGTISETEKKQFSETISRNGNTLIKIIDDVLDLSKVEANCLELEKIEVAIEPLLQNVVQQFKDSARSKNLSIVLDIEGELPPTILSDSVRIQQVITNLLSNAVKFTDRGGVIVQVKSITKESSKTEIQIRVIDTGIGLTEEQKIRIFQPFRQAETSTTRRFGGTGLGLALSKHLAEALGGGLVVERGEQDAGCTFTFTLTAEIPACPSLKVAEPVFAPPQTDLTPLAGVKILLAEDSIDNQYFIERFLAKNGALVSVTDNGCDVLQKCKTETFDVILMDIEMPLMDGYETTRQLRQLGMNIPILALTAHAMAEERIKTREAGCNGHLTKPIDTRELLCVLESILNPALNLKH